MIRKIVVTGMAAAAVLGTGTGALALSGSSGSGTTAGTGSTSTSAKHGNRLGKALLHHAVHGQVITHNKDGYVRHDGILGAVAAVSPSAITVRAADGYRETFVVAATTKVRKRANGAGSPSTLSAVHVGDQVAVVGKTAGGARGSATARVIVDGVSR